MFLRPAATLTALYLGLAACSSGTTTPDAPEPPTPEELFAARDEAARALSNSLATRSPTFSTNRPTTGSATYTGDAVLAIPRDAGDIAMLGDISITADFATNRLSGSVTNLTGGVIAAADELPQTVIRYSGSLDLREGSIYTGVPLAGGARPVAAGAALTGTLTGGGSTIRMDANVEGALIGNPTPIGIAMSGDSGSAVVDGIEYQAIATVVARR